MNQREIKFRAIGTITKKNFGIFTPLDLDFVMPNFPEDITWLQFTGLKDKNSKEIYEGDIVETPNRKKPYLIRFAGGKFYLDYTEEGEDLTDPLWIKVIGNIYENPELLTP